MQLDQRHCVCAGFQHLGVQAHCRFTTQVKFAVSPCGQNDVFKLSFCSCIMIFFVGLRQGWGLTHDGRQFIFSDGSANLFFCSDPELKVVAFFSYGPPPDAYRHPSTLSTKVTSYVTVRDNARAVSNLNELEYIQGGIFANIYMQNIIVIVNPQNGIVERSLDLTSLIASGEMTGKAPPQLRANAVLNGIAFDKGSSELVVTGKLYDSLWHLKLTGVPGLSQTVAPTQAIALFPFRLPQSFSPTVRLRKRKKSKKRKKKKAKQKTTAALR
jgi:hypothetical protein